MVPTVNWHLDVKVPLASYGTFMKADGQVLNDVGVLEPMRMTHEDPRSSILKESDEFYKTAKQVDTLFTFFLMSGFATLAWFNVYHPYDDHFMFILGLVAAHPNSAKVITVRKSVEGHAITGINILVRRTVVASLSPSGARTSTPVNGSPT
ncbi:hypothetical protein CPB86DRAFT_878717 [Serendipita vermifera]|nr:hypothetical protein CPB86DRAFT_878717 [Serendipita vermifera]